MGPSALGQLFDLPSGHFLGDRRRDWGAFDFGQFGVQFGNLCAAPLHRFVQCVAFAKLCQCTRRFFAAMAGRNAVEIVERSIDKPDERRSAFFDALIGGIKIGDLFPTNFDLCFGRLNELVRKTTLLLKAMNFGFFPADRLAQRGPFVGPPVRNRE
jgi:hypothetical protein